MCLILTEWTRERNASFLVNSSNQTNTSNSRQERNSPEIQRVRLAARQLSDGHRKESFVRLFRSVCSESPTWIDSLEICHSHQSRDKEWRVQKTRRSSLRAISSGSNVPMPRAIRWFVSIVGDFQREKRRRAALKSLEGGCGCGCRGGDEKENTHRHAYRMMSH